MNYGQEVVLREILKASALILSINDHSLGLDTRRQGSIRRYYCLWS